MLEDGIYLVKRGFDGTLDDAKTLTVSAYNNLEDPAFKDFSVWIRFSRAAGDGWSEFTTFGRTTRGSFRPPVSPLVSYYDAYGNVVYPGPRRYFDHVQPGSYHSIGAWPIFKNATLGAQWIPFSAYSVYHNAAAVYHDSDGYIFFRFNRPVHTDGSIVKISVWCYVKGVCSTIFHGGHQYINNALGLFYVYGTQSSPDNIAHWIHSDYYTWPLPVYPGTPGTTGQGAPFQWSFEPVAGVWASNTGNGECYEVKVVITRLVDGVEYEETLLPVSDYEYQGISWLYTKFANPFIDSATRGYNEDLYYQVNGLYDQAGFNAADNFSGYPYAYYSSNFSSFPPKGSKINSVSVTYHFNAGGTGCTVTPYLKLDGVRYYGTETPISVVPGGTELTYTWITDPTGNNWDYQKTSAMEFGLSAGRAPYSNSSFYVLYATITYQEATGDTVDYDKIAASKESIVLVQHPQNPIEPDELYFTIPYYLPQRTEIVYVKSGVHVFHGIVWDDIEPHSNIHHIYCKSMAAILDYRYMPPFFYNARKNRYKTYYSIDQLFSDDVPEYSFWQYIYGLGDQQWGVYGPTTAIGKYSEDLCKHNTDVGLLFLLNSQLIADYDTDHLINCADRIKDRQLFAMHSTPEVANNDYYTYDSSDHSYHNKTPEVAVGGISRLRYKSTLPCGGLDYYISDNNLYLSSYASSKYVLADHCADTHIRLGTFELSDKYLNVPYMFGNNTWAKEFDKFFESLGQEVQFKNHVNGNVYLNTATEISRGSATEPLKKFEHNVNCRILAKRSWDPKPNLTVGKSIIPQTAGSFEISRSIIIKTIEDATRDGQDLRDYLEFQSLVDEDAYIVEYNSEEPLLRVGDWIWVKPEGAKDYIALRIKQNTTKNNFTQLIAGKQLFSLTKQFGQWRNLVGTLGTDHKYISQAIALTGTGGTQSFTVSSADISSDEYRCRLNLTIDYHIATDPTLSLVNRYLRGGATASITGSYTGSVRIGYALQIYKSDYWFWDAVNAQYGWSPAQYRIATQDINLNWSAWGDLMSLPYDNIAPLGNGLGLHISYDPGYPGHNVDIGGSAWEVYALSPIQFNTYDQTMLRIKINGKVIPPGRTAINRNNNSIDMDITSYVSAGTNTLDVYLKGGLTQDDWPTWYHTETGSIDQYKRVKAVLDA